MRKIIMVHDTNTDKIYEYEPRPQFYDVDRIIQQLRRYETKVYKLDRAWRSKLIYKIKTING